MCCECDTGIEPTLQIQQTMTTLVFGGIKTHLHRKKCKFSKQQKQ